jgi:predicted Zn-dependent protease
MKKIISSLSIIALLLLFSCSGSKKIVKQNAPATLSVQAVAADGSSFEKAIVINEQHEKQGIDAEYAWIRQHYPGSKVVQQTLNNYKGKSYDILYINTEGAGEKKIYFDISNFLGKF